MAIQSRWALNSLDRHASLAMTRENLQRRNVQVGSLALQAAVLGPERLLRLDVLGVDRYARHRADLHALGFVKVSDALGAFVRVDFVNFRAQINRLIGALRLTHITVDAFVGDHQSHVESSAKVAIRFMRPIIGEWQQPAPWQGCCRIVEFHNITRVHTL